MAQHKLADRFGKIASLLISNPRLLAGIGYAYFANKIGQVPKGCVIKEINGVKFEFDFDYGPHIRRMFFNAYESLVISAMKRFLKEGDTFIDVGANIGFLSAVAAGIVGKRGQVHSFEPVPRDYERLKRLASLNPDYRIFANPYALGAREETADMDISSLSWVGWNTMVPNFMRRTDWKETIQVSVMRLDDYIFERRKEMGRIALIKIDTEGFEFFVLKGLENFLEKDADRPAIICEVTPRANGLIGVDLADFYQLMDRLGYDPVSLLDLRTKIPLADLKKQADILFLPN